MDNYLALGQPPATMPRGNGSGQGMQWQLHWLEAEGDLGPWRDRISAEIEATRQLFARALAPPRLDILVQRLAGAVISEIGMVGQAYRKGLCALTLDPDDPRFAAGLQDGTLRRQVAHEVHHCLRMAGPGYGWTLGEALVSEGLAGRFTGWLFGSSAELWEVRSRPRLFALTLPTNQCFKGRATTTRGGSLALVTAAAMAWLHARLSDRRRLADDGGRGER